MKTVFALLMLAAWFSPPLENGTYTWKTLPSEAQLDLDGVPLTSPTRSIGIQSPADGLALGCANVDEAVSYDETNPLRIQTTIPAPTQGQRVKVQAFAFSQVDCQGLMSAGSADFGAVFFGPPGRSRFVR